MGRALTDMPHEEAWQDEFHRNAGADAVQDASINEREAIVALEQALANREDFLQDVEIKT